MVPSFFRVGLRLIDSKNPSERSLVGVEFSEPASSRILISCFFEYVCRQV